VYPSKFHRNKKPHNWLVYHIGDRFIKKHKHLYCGVLVDLGCGECPYKDYFMNHVDSYIGVDWTNSLHNSKAEIESDLNKEIKLDDEMADTIISFSVLEHLCEPQRFVDESYRILKKGGNIVLQVPWQWHIHEAPYDYFRYTPYGLKYMFEKAGYSNIKIITQSGYFVASAIKFNYFLARLIHKLPKFIMYPLAFLFLPLWTITQLISPVLDKLDSNWEAEAIGFFVCANKNE